MMPRSEISTYAPLPFHTIRALALTSTIIISAVLGYFCFQLKNDGFKLPWTLLVMLAGSLLAFLHLVVSYIFYARGRLSPLLNMIVSGPVLLVYTIGFALLVWNMYGTLSHSCSKTNWANDDGMFVCRVYKAFFSFVVIGWLCQIALIIVDVRAKRVQSTLGRYNKMDETSSKDVKLESLDHSRNTSTQDIPYGIDDYRDQSNSTNSVNAQHQRYSSPYDAERSQLHRVDDFYYETPPQHTTYQPQQSYPNTNHYQPTYDGMRLR